MDPITDFFHELFHDAWRIRLTLALVAGLGAVLGLCALFKTRCPHCGRFFALEETLSKDTPDQMTYRRYRCKRCGSNTWKSESNRPDTPETYWE